MRTWNQPKEIPKCPECGSTLKKSSFNRYCCENQKCPLIFIKHPNGDREKTPKVAYRAAFKAVRT